MNALTEIKQLVRLALPVSLAQLAIVGMTATDVLIAGWAGTQELAGMNLGVNTWNMIAMLFMGIGLATQPLVARQYGAKNHKGVKHQLHQSIWLCLFLGVLCTLSAVLGAYALSAIAFEPELLRIAQSYLLVISLCGIPFILLPALRGTLEGVSLTKPVMLLSFAAFLINIPLDYILVNGLYGLPKLGAVGCAWATVSVVYIMVGATLWLLKKHPQLVEQKVLSDFEPIDRATIWNTLKLGFPIGLSITIELSMFSGAGILIAKFGVIETAAHAVAITIASASFVFYMGLGQGVTIRASQRLGADDPEGARYSVKVGTGLNVFLSAIIAVLFVAFTEPLIRLASSDETVVELGITLLLFGAAFQIADSLQVAIICALRAYHDTVSPPKYQVFSFLLFGLPLGIGLSFFAWWPGLEGAKGMWVAMTASLYLIAILLFYRYLRMVNAYEHHYANGLPDSNG